MTSALPNEILTLIFQQLHPDDQMECMLVCHRWNQLIEDYVLYRTVFIFSLSCLKKLLQKIQQRSDIANRIERLHLFSIDDDEAVVTNRKLLLLTPNLKVLCFDFTDAFFNIPVAFFFDIQYPWYKKIEHISEFKYFSEYEDPFDFFLSSHICPNLKTLSYCNYGEYHPLIKNASGLTSLILSGVTLNLDDLEGIHKNAPNLKSLRLDLLDYSGICVFPGNAITPATSVTDFVADMTSKTREREDLTYAECNVQLLVYISRKYPNLSTLEYLCDTFIDLDYSETNEIIEMGWNPLLQRLGPQLKKVHFYLSGHQDESAEIFDRYGCQLDYLDLHCGFRKYHVEIAQSKQAFYIQTLVLFTTFPSLDWLKNFRVLKKLELHYKGISDQPHRMQLSDILDNSPPTLESLSLKAPFFDIDPNYTGTSNIKTLIFRYMKFDDKVDGFISRCFPKLSKLELRWCELQNNRLKLEKTDLVSFHYHNGCSGLLERNNVILATTLKDNNRRYYALYNKRTYTDEETFYPQNYRPFKSYSASDTNDSVPELNFICNSVKNVVFTYSQRGIYVAPDQ